MGLLGFVTGAIKNPLSGLSLVGAVRNSVQSAVGSAIASIPRLPGMIPVNEVRSWGFGALSLVPQISSILGGGGGRPAAPIGAQGPNAPTTNELAAMSNSVYGNGAVPPAGWRVATDQEKAAIGLRPEQLTSTNSAFRAEVYVKGSGADTHYTVAFRGSTKDASDWISNAKQAFGVDTDHYRKALDIGKSIAISGAENVTITGHSLGGGLASAASVASGMRAETFNAAGLSKATLDKANAIRTQNSDNAAPTVNAYYVRGEILSTLQDGGDNALGILFPALGAAGFDLPSAYGNRIGLDVAIPDGKHWWNVNPANLHKMDWVVAALEAR